MIQRSDGRRRRRCRDDRRHGLGSHLHVTIEGQPATVLPSLSDT
jgi:hypothetical protein